MTTSYNKSKCLVVQPRQNGGLPSLNLATLNFRVGGNDTEIVSEWFHLGHIISSHCLDDSDIFHRRNCMIGQVNYVLCYFGKLPSSVKLKLLYAYSSSLYGCELWDLWNKNIDRVSVALRKALRRAWNWPCSTHCDFLFELSNALPVYDVICKRVLSFITKCVHSDCYIVKAVGRHAILHCHMTSPLGCGALYCGLRFKFDIGRLLDLRFDYCNVSAEMLANVSVLKDFLLFLETNQNFVPICPIRTISHVLLRVYAPADFLNRFVIGFYF